MRVDQPGGGQAAGGIDPDRPVGLRTRPGPDRGDPAAGHHHVPGPVLGAGVGGAGAVHGGDGAPVDDERVPHKGQAGPRGHQPLARHSGTCGRSAPSVVSLPCPG